MGWPSGLGFLSMRWKWKGSVGWCGGVWVCVSNTVKITFFVIIFLNKSFKNLSNYFTHPNQTDVAWVCVDRGRVR